MYKPASLIRILFVLLLCFSFQKASTAQCDTIARMCNKNIKIPFVSDGQSYRSLLLNDQQAEFQTTFYGGATYRVAGCTFGSETGLNFTVFDQDRNVIFSNKDQKNAPYWDFKVSSTLDCIIEANLNPASGRSSGCAVILIGFKQ
ncbi:MAG TPA: hypothetical protein VNZ86_08875 [Bacteroidia bacterium]|nr:hypothetical protein [Bacteroidia bacterium]